MAPLPERRLSLIDVAFFVLETAERPMSVGPLIVLAPPRSGRGRSGFADALYRRMLRRPVGAPFNLRLNAPTLRALPALGALPALVPDPAFELAQHVHRHALPRPGTMAVLAERVCELHMQRLDRSRPLWELHLFEGLEDGRIALYPRMHHGIVDGAGFVRILSRWLATSPSERQVRAIWEGSGEEAGSPSHDPRRSVGRDVGGLVRSGTDAARTALSFGRLLWRQGLATAGLREGAPLPFLATPQVLKAAPSARRAFAFCTLPLDRMKALGKARQATINDVVLAVLDIALRRYLDRSDSAPEASLVVDMPVALGAGGSGGNRIAMVQVPLGTAGLDPAARLEAIKARTRSIKGQVREGSGDAEMLHSVVFHGLLSLWEAVGWRSAPLLANLVVSNPFGFAEKRYLMGAEVEVALPVSVIAPGQVMNVTGVNHGNDYQIAFLAIAEAVPGIEDLASDTVEAFESLAGSLGEARVRRSAARNKRR